jgi:hypothetical protein
MIRLKYGLLGGKRFADLSERIRITKHSQANTENLWRFMNALKNAQKKLQEEYLVIMNKYAKRNPDGTLPAEPEMDPEQREVLQAAVAEFSDKDVYIEVAPINMKWLVAMQLSLDDRDVLEELQRHAPRERDEKTGEEQPQLPEATVHSLPAASPLPS